MPKTIKNLLIGIGFDVDQKSKQNVTSGFDEITSKATRMGAVVRGALGVLGIGAAGAAGGFFAARNFAETKDRLGKLSQVLGDSAGDIQAWGHALSMEGGSLEDFISQLDGLVQKRDRLRTGDASFIAPAELAGLNTEPLINANSGIEMLRELTKQFPNLDDRGRRLAAEAMGLDKPTQRLLSRGLTEVDAMLADFKKMQPITTEMTRVAAEFNDRMHILNTNIAGFSDIIGEDLTRTASEAVGWLNETIDSNRDLIRSVLEGNFPELVPDGLWNTKKGSGGQMGRQRSGGGDFQGATMDVIDAFGGWLSPYFEPSVSGGAMTRRGRRGGDIQVNAHIDVSMNNEVFDRHVVRAVEVENGKTIEDISSSEGG